MPENNERDTHFAGFAKLLWLEMNDKGQFNIDMEAPNTDEIVVSLIARRAYDLVYAACESIDDRQTNYEARITLESMIDNAPDMTAFPTPH